MIEGKLEENKIVLEDRDFFDKGWYGDLVDERIELAPVEALYLASTEKIAVLKGKKKLSVKELFNLFSEDPEFMIKYYVYTDLRERGLVVKIGYEGSNFIVYERGATPHKSKVAWVVFVNSEDSACEIDTLAKISKLAKNIRSQALWAVVDNDSDITYYIVEEEKV